MTELRRLEVASRVYRRVLHELNRAGSVEVGGAFVGHIVASESGGVDAHVLDFIPAGPHPEEATDVAFLADRVYQLWTFQRLLEVQPDLSVIGMWHSHVPNGLDTFSEVDHRSVQSKLNLDPDLPGFLSALIWESPDDEVQCHESLRFAWYPRSEGALRWNWVEQGHIKRVEGHHPSSWEQLMDLESHDAYFDATRRFAPSGQDWMHAVNHLALANPVSDHDVLLDEQGDEVLIVEPTSRGAYFLHLCGRKGRISMLSPPDEDVPWLEAEHAALAFYESLAEVQSMPTRWDHLNPSLATLGASMVGPDEPTSPWPRWLTWLNPFASKK